MWQQQHTVAAAAAAANGAGTANGANANTNASAQNNNGEVWMDERELKRQRRKQSNRESARRSRLRKQAECEELGGRVDALSTENVTLRAELNRLKDACAAINTDNTMLSVKLRKLNCEEGVTKAEVKTTVDAVDGGEKTKEIAEGKDAVEGAAA